MKTAQIVALFLFCSSVTAGENTAPDGGSLLPLFLPALLTKANHWPDWPDAGNPAGGCRIPAAAKAEDSSRPDRVIGNGTPQSCTSEAVINAIAKGGIITFDCGPHPLIITLRQTAKVHNSTGPKIVIDGGGKVALSGGGKRRILYMNTCDPSLTWTTSHCQNQDHPQLTLQNLVFLQGNSSDDAVHDGGGAIWARGGRLKIVNCRFFNNTCATDGADLGGAALRAFSQYDNLPLYVVNSTFGGDRNVGNSCANGGGLSGIGVSYSVFNSLFSHNRATGRGANPPRPGTPGGGSGGAIYTDGNAFDLTLCGTVMENNTAREGGGGIFFVSNNLTGRLIISRSLLQNNISQGFENYPGIFFKGEGAPQISDSVVR